MAALLLPHLIHPTIIVGGSGARLWPASRDTMPKQFVSLLRSGRLTFEETLLRVALEGFARPIVITKCDLRFVVAEQLAHLGIEAEIVLEFERRDSAAAITAGAVMVAGWDEVAVCLVLAADHLIPGGELFAADCSHARRIAAAERRIMLLGIDPTGPSTTYGNIAPDAPLSEAGAFHVDRFSGKPDPDTASAYVRDGYL